MVSIFIQILLVLLTIGYAWVIWLGLGIYSILYDPSNHQTSLTAVSILADSSLVIVWQVLAAFSLVACLLWTYFRTKQSQSVDGIILPALVHILWLLTSLTWIVVGAIDPFLMTAYTI